MFIMAAQSSTALTKRSSENALMPPPPPPKRIKRPPKVLDEEEYTAALSEIIARDFFPGLLESQAQQEYLTALESNDSSWIATAGQTLRDAMTTLPGKRRARATRLDPSATPRPDTTPRYGGETPKGWSGATPSVAGTEISEAESEAADQKAIDTSGLSLSAFQQKFTSGDNESFNTLLDKQNLKKREKHAFLWNENKIPAARQLLHRAREAKLLTQKQEASSNDKALIPITTGATSSRPAQPTAWQKSNPANNFMFIPSGIEDDLETVAQKRENESRAAPKQTVYSNTRLPPPPLPPQQASIPPSPSLSAVRDAIAGNPRLSSSELGSDVYTGAETPRVNGYAFVDEDEPEPQPLPTPPTQETEENPSYRDLLAGQYSGSSSNPFKISESSKRESLHHRMVEKTARAKREKRKETVKTPVPKFPSSPMIGVGNDGGERTPRGEEKGGSSSAGGAMTPAARKLMEKIGGRTPRPGGEGGKGASGLRSMWTPTTTPRRKSGLGK